MISRLLSVPALLWLGYAAAPARANVISNCVQGTNTAGVLTSCFFNHNAITFTGNVTMTETFTSNAPNVVGVGLFLNNSVPGIFDYTITKIITNNTGTDWYGFSTAVPGASALGPVTFVSGFASCGLSSGAVNCSGGSVPNNGTLVLQFHASTPFDQNAGAFPLFQSATVPEPSTLLLSGVGLIVITRLRRRTPPTA